MCARDRRADLPTRRRPLLRRGDPPSVVLTEPTEFVSASLDCRPGRVDPLDRLLACMWGLWCLTVGRDGRRGGDQRSGGAPTSGGCGSSRCYAACGCRRGRYDVDPDDLVQEAFTRVLVALPASTDRVPRGTPNRPRRGECWWVAYAHADFVETSPAAPPPSDLSDLLRLEPVSRGLLYLVEVEGYPIREAASMVGCSEPAVRFSVPRPAVSCVPCWSRTPAMTDVRDGLRRLGARGEPRGAERVTGASVAEATLRLERVRPPRRFGRVAVGFAIACVVVGAIGVAVVRSDTTPSTTSVDGLRFGAVDRAATDRGYDARSHNDRAGAADGHDPARSRRPGGLGRRAGPRHRDGW